MGSDVFLFADGVSEGDVGVFEGFALIGSTGVSTLGSCGNCGGGVGYSFILGTVGGESVRTLGTAGEMGVCTLGTSSVACCGTRVVGVGGELVSLCLVSVVLCDIVKAQS